MSLLNKPVPSYQLVSLIFDSEAEGVIAMTLDWNVCFQIIFFLHKDPGKDDSQTDLFLRFSDPSNPEVDKTTLVQEVTEDVRFPCEIPQRILKNHYHLRGIQHPNFGF